MVSKASDDLPEPERPVNTISLSRGRSSVTFLRLCSRAPWMTRRSEPTSRVYRRAATRLPGPVPPRRAASILGGHGPGPPRDPALSRGRGALPQGLRAGLRSDRRTERPGPLARRTLDRLHRLGPGEARGDARDERVPGAGRRRTGPAGHRGSSPRRWGQVVARRGPALVRLGPAGEGTIAAVCDVGRRARRGATAAGDRRNCRSARVVARRLEDPRRGRGAPRRRGRRGRLRGELRPPRAGTPRVGPQRRLGGGRGAPA